MSVLGFLGYTMLLGAACFASWKGALYRDVRTREARDEDPRDQEIRELGAALSIARKELASTSEDKDARSTQAAELTSKLEHTSSSLANIQQKFNATKEHLNREIEAKQELNEELAHLRRDLEQSQTRVTDLEIQSKVNESGSGIISGMDMLDDDDSELEALQAQIQQLQQEAERWKQHCVVLTKANKDLRDAEASADAGPS